MEGNFVFSKYRLISFALMLITFIFLSLLITNNSATRMVSTYLILLYGVFFVLFLGSWALHVAFGIATIPFGDYDPDTYPLQAIFGYDGAFIVAVIFAIILWGWAANVATVDHQIVLPIQQMYASKIPAMTGTFQAFSTTAYQISGGMNAQAFAIAHALPATVVENPLLIGVWAFFLWIGVRGLLDKIFGVPTPIANLVGMVAWILITPTLFSFMYHASGAYGGNELAYARASDFALYSMIPVALTGFPLPMDAAHFSNNYHVAKAEIEGQLSIIYKSQQPSGLSRVGASPA